MAVGGGWGGGARRKQKQEKVLEFYQKMFKQTLKEKKIQSEFWKEANVCENSFTRDELSRGVEWRFS